MVVLPLFLSMVTVDIWMVVLPVFLSMVTVDIWMVVLPLFLSMVTVDMNGSVTSVSINGNCRHEW
jgi:hypothetical protein